MAKACLMAICNYFLLFVAFEGLLGAAASSLFKRDAPLATVNIPLTVNKDRRYVLGVNMSTSNPQSFKFALTANTGYSAVAGVSCNGCDGVPTYNASASSSQRSFPGSANFTVGSAAISGPFVKENCSLHQMNGSAWQYPNQTIIVANSSSSLFSDVTSGLIGLGTNANGQSGDFYDTVFGGWLVRNPTRNNFTFGMDLKPPVFTSDNDQGSGGVLHWVEPDSSAYQGNIQFISASVSSDTENVSTVTSNAISGFELPESDWSIEMDGWTASISGTAVANSSRSLALIEPFFPDIFFPVSQANLLYAAVPSAVKINSFVAGAQAWSIPCDTALSTAFSFAGQAFLLDETQLIETQADGSCIGTIKAWPDDSVNNFMLGSSFISALYLIYVIGRPGSGVPNSIGIGMKATNNSSGTPVGAIVGGTVGGVVGVGILIGGAYWLGRRHRRKSSQPGMVPTSPRVGEKENFMSTQNEDRSEEGGVGGAQYANYSLPHYGPQKYSPTTPLTGNSTHPLLPDGQYQSQYPQLPSLPNTPHPPPSDFLTMSVGSRMSGSMSGNLSHTGEPSATSVGSRISHNPHAFLANMSNARTTPISGSVEPFVLPPGAGTGDHPRKVAQGHPPAPSPSTYLPEVYDPPAGLVSTNANNPAPPSPQDIDPFSPSSSSGAGATIQPFVLAPVPESVRQNTGAKGSGASRPSRVAVPRDAQAQTHPPPPETPAPPYTAHAIDNPVSPTLVGVESSSSQGASTPSPRREKS